MDDTKIVKPGDEIKPEWWWAVPCTDEELEIAREESKRHANDNADLWTD